MSPLEPTNPREEIVNEAIELISRRVEEEGLTLIHTFVTFHVEEGDPDDNAATGFHYEGPDGTTAEEAESELFYFLLAQLKGVGKKIGLDVRVFSPPGGVINSG